MKIKIPSEVFDYFENSTMLIGKLNELSQWIKLDCVEPLLNTISFDSTNFREMEIDEIGRASCRERV